MEICLDCALVLSSAMGYGLQYGEIVHNYKSTLLLLLLLNLLTRKLGNFMAGHSKKILFSPRKLRLKGDIKGRKREVN